MNTGGELDGVLYRAIIGMIYPQGKGGGRGIFVFCCGLGCSGCCGVLWDGSGGCGGVWFGLNQSILLHCFLTVQRYD